MPADDLCPYHYITYVLSNGAAEPSETSAMRFRQKVVTLLQSQGHKKQANRLLLSGSAGYPGEPNFAAIATVAGLSFAIVQEILFDPLVYGSEHGRSS